MTLRAAATLLFALISFIVLNMATGLISANVRKLADKYGWDNFLVRWAERMSWERLRGLWWLWTILGLSGGVAFALWLSAPTTLSAPLDKDIDDLKAENSQLKGSLSATQSQLQLALNDARKWRFSYELRNTPKAENGERISCQYAVGVSHTNAASFMGGSSANA